eukprot:COSAG02_NODE_2431_length_8875_cov_9.810164_5_plen_81_part_00
MNAMHHEHCGATACNTSVFINDIHDERVAMLPLRLNTTNAIHTPSVRLFLQRQHRLKIHICLPKRHSAQMRRNLGPGAVD